MKKKRPRGRPLAGNKRVVLKLDPAIDERLSRQAKKAGITRSAMVEQALIVHFGAGES